MKVCTARIIGDSGDWCPCGEPADYHVWHEYHPNTITAGPTGIFVSVWLCRRHQSEAFPRSVLAILYQEEQEREARYAAKTKQGEAQV